MKGRSPRSASRGACAFDRRLVAITKPLLGWLPPASPYRTFGARRLYTVMERLLDDVSFHAARRTGEHIVIDAAFVEATLANIAGNDNLSRYIL